MIDDKTWMTNLALLCTHFNYVLLDPVEPIWRRYLNEHLTSQQFVKAVETAIIKCPVNRMPNAEQLAEFGGAGMKQKILTYWSRIDDARKRVPTHHDSLKEYEDIVEAMNLDCVASKALKILGHLKGLSRVSDDYIHIRRKEFEDLYKTWDAKRDELEVQHQEQLALRAAQALAALPPSDLQPMPVDLGERMEGLKSAFAMPKEPEPEPVKETIEERQAKNQAVLQRWKEQGLLKEEQEV